MPGYANPTSPTPAGQVIVVPTGNLVSTNLDGALSELDSDITSALNTVNASLVNKANLLANGTIIQNNQTILNNFTFPSNTNGVSAGPITIASGVTVTIPSGSEWSIV